MLSVGLTGGIGSGKSSVAEIFRQKGAHIVDFDKIAHETYCPQTDTWEKIVAAFGSEILDTDATISRARLGALVFADRQKLKDLCAIVHPAIIERWQQMSSQIVANRADAIIVADVPLLFEVRLQRLFDVTVMVYCPSEEQIERVMIRNDWQREMVLSRIAAQLPIEEKAKMADLLIDNGGDFSRTLANVELIWGKLTTMERNKREKAVG